MEVSTLTAQTNDQVCKSFENTELVNVQESIQSQYTKVGFKTIHNVCEAVIKHSELTDT